MAMINDKGPEESRDTDGTYIILSHQSVHLPGPSRQRMGRVGEVEEEVKGKDKKKRGEGRELSTPSLLHTGIAFLLYEENEKSDKEVIR